MDKQTNNGNEKPNTIDITDADLNALCCLLDSDFLRNGLTRGDGKIVTIGGGLSNVEKDALRKTYSDCKVKTRIPVLQPIAKGSPESITIAAKPQQEKPIKGAVQQIIKPVKQLVKTSSWKDSAKQLASNAANYVVDTEESVVKTLENFYDTKGKFMLNDAKAFAISAGQTMSTEAEKVLTATVDTLKPLVAPGPDGEPAYCRYGGAYVGCNECVHTNMPVTLDETVEVTVQDV